MYKPRLLLIHPGQDKAARLAHGVDGPRSVNGVDERIGLGLMCHLIRSPVSFAPSSAGQGPEHEDEGRHAHTIAASCLAGIRRPVAGWDTQPWRSSRARGLQAAVWRDASGAVR